MCAIFGDYWQNFGLNFPFFGTDPQGGLFGSTAGPGGHDQLQMPGMGSSSAEAVAGGPAATSAFHGADMMNPAPAGSAVAQGPHLGAATGSPGAGSPLAAGGDSPMAPGQQRQQRSGLEGVDRDLVGQILKGFGIDRGMSRAV